MFSRFVLAMLLRYFRRGVFGFRRYAPPPPLPGFLRRHFDAALHADYTALRRDCHFRHAIFSALPLRGADSHIMPAR